MRQAAAHIAQYDEYVMDYRPDGPVLSAYHKAWPFMSVIRGPMGSGKTKGSIAGKIFDRIHDMPVDRNGVRRSRWVSVRNTQDDHKRVTIPDWEEVFDEGSFGQIRRSSPLIHRVRSECESGFPVEAEMHFIALDKPGAERLLRGFQGTGCHFGELKELRHLIVDITLGRMGRYPARNDMPERPSPHHWEGGDPHSWWYHDYTQPATVPGHPEKGQQRYWFGGFGDTNAWDDEHWLERMEHEKKPSNWIFFTQPGGVIEDPPGAGKFIPNPMAENLANLDPGYYTTKVESTDVRVARVEYANQIGQKLGGQLVHPGYRADTHKRHVDYIPGLPVYMGNDYGRTPAAALFQIVSGGYQFFDELCTEGMSADQFRPELAAYVKGKYGAEVGTILGGGDPAGAHAHETSSLSAIQYMNQGTDFYVIPSPIPNQDMFSRRKALSGPLHRLRTDGLPAVMISGENCPHLCRGLGSKFYFRKMAISSDELYTAQPVKNFWSHICEAAENGLATFGEGATLGYTEDDRDKGRPWDA